jgi:hypothetical protein
MSIFPDEPSAEERKEKLDQDYDTPFRPADDTNDAGALDDTHQVTDTNLDPHEQYEEGVSGAAEASEPNANSAVLGYDPSKDQRKQQADEPNNEGVS